MKDIENSMAQSAAALARLQRALGRLDAATRKPRPESATPTPAPGIASADAGKLARDHAALREATGRVAARLDETITRLALGLREAG